MQKTQKKILAVKLVYIGPRVGPRFRSRDFATQQMRRHHIDTAKEEMG